MSSLGEVRSVGMITTILMITVALVFDGLQFILTLLLVGVVLNPIITVAAYLIFFLWFTLGCGVKFRGKSLTGGITTLILEFVPGLNALPGITFGVVITILTSWSEATLAKGGAVGAVAKKTTQSLEKKSLARKGAAEKETAPKEKEASGETRPTREQLPERELPTQTESPEPVVGQEVRQREPLKSFPIKPVGQKPPSRT